MPPKKKGGSLVFNVKCGSLVLLLMIFLVLLNLYHQDFSDNIDGVIIKVLILNKNKL